MDLFPNLTHELREIKKTLVKKIYIEAFKRILSERVIVEIFHDKGKTRYILGLKELKIPLEPMQKPMLVKPLI
ncbi:hypothetical protein FOH38_22485 [Lysinibacillus fusiformis]|nr:hypothetical protein FOH38_22485 [Lysinibacillus fusiformis]